MINRFKTYIKWTILTCHILLVFLVGSSNSQVIRDSVSELNNIDVEEKLGQIIPADLKFVDDDGNPVTIDTYLNQGKPVVLVMGYYECPMLCNLVSNALLETMISIDWQLGKEYSVVNVSINPKEDAALAKNKKINYIKAMGIESAASGWHFLTGAEDQSKALADAIGFKYYYDEKAEQYAHPALITILTDQGKISRYLYGVEYNQNDFKLSLLEASEGKIGNTLDKIILFCYHYDPAAGGYVVFAENVMKLGGTITVVALLLIVGTLLYRERKKKAKKAKTSAAVNNTI